MRYAFVVTVLSAGSAWGQGAATSPAETAAPPAILDYYRRHNFVTAFSTPQERQVLAENREEPADARLARVSRTMRELESHLEAFDPDMTRSNRSAPALVYRSDLLRINGIWRENGGIWVELEALSIGPADRVFYVSHFDELSGGDRMPDVEDLLRIRSTSAMLSAPERHRWQRVRGGWRRASMTLFFIAY